jgi:hypothetical protein
MQINEGDVNQNGQKLVRKTDTRSTTHRFARIWVMRCPRGHEYGSNSCDAHIRRCPSCDTRVAQGEPILNNSAFDGSQE